VSASRAKRRLALEAPDGQVVVHDLSRPGARLVELDLPDGRRVRVAEHLCGWAGTDDPAAGEPLWRTVGDAVEALTGRSRGGEPWITVLEEFATGLSATPAAPVAPELADRLGALVRDLPGVYVDGPRAHDSGGWYTFVGGLPDGGWVMEFGDTPEAAARAALAAAEGRIPRE
jgi:hypothetical protein